MVVKDILKKLIHKLINRTQGDCDCCKVKPFKLPVE